MQTLQLISPVELLGVTNDVIMCVVQLPQSPTHGLCSANHQHHPHRSHHAPRECLHRARANTTLVHASIHLHPSQRLPQGDIVTPSFMGSLEGLVIKGGAGTAEPVPFSAALGCLGSAPVVTQNHPFIPTTLHLTQSHVWWEKLTMEEEKREVSLGF